MMNVQRDNNPTKEHQKWKYCFKVIEVVFVL